MTATPEVNQDFVDMLMALGDQGVDFVVVGAYALAAHGLPRATGDIDILVRPGADNAERVYAALVDFGAPVEAHGVLPEDFTKEGTVYQIGLPPRRIDLLTSISGVDYAEAATGTLNGTLGGCSVRFIGRAALVHNKRASGRSKDAADVEQLKKLPENA